MKSANQLVRKVIFELEDGTTEEWDFPPGDQTAYYHISRNHRTKGRGNPTVIAQWKEHTIKWTSDRWEEVPKIERATTMVSLMDKHGRATGRLIPG